MTSPCFQFKSFNYQGLAPGVRLIVLGAVHGNEVCGTQAIHQVIQALDAGDITLKAGSVTFVPVTNPMAYAKNERNGQRNLNRNLYPKAQPQDFEDEIANWLCPLLARHDVLLDLHSFHTPGQPMVMMGPEDNTGSLEPFSQAAAENALACVLGVNRFVDGWLDTYAKGVARRQARFGDSTDYQQLLNNDVRYGVGTTEYMREQGGYALTLECGQHQAPDAAAIGYKAIINTLIHLGLIEGEAPQPVQARQCLRLYDVIDREAPEDAFNAAWESFQPVAAGTVIGTRASGEAVVADQDGFIVFPNPRALVGQEWFYLAKPVARF